MRKRGRAGNPHFSFGSDPTQQLYAHSSLVHSNPTLGVSANARQPSDAKSVGNIIEIKIDTPQLYRQATDQSSYSDVTTLVSRDHSRKQSDKNSTQKALFIAVDKSKTALSLMRDGKSPIDTEAAKSPVGVVSPLLTPCSSHNPTPEPSIPKFTVGERVDGLYTLQNGSERWFAGEVIKVNGDDTYALMFDDGEVKEAQPAARIRVSRQRKKTSLSNSATNSAEGTPSKSAPGAPNTNADSRVVENRAIDTTIALLSSPTATPHSPDKFFDLTPSSDLTAGEFSFSTPGRETMAERGMVPTLETIEDNSVADQTIYANRTEDSEADPLTKAIAALVNADSVESLDDSDEDSGDFVFEIPSVFDNGPRTNNLKCAGDTYTPLPLRSISELVCILFLSYF